MPLTPSQLGLIGQGVSTGGSILSSAMNIYFQNKLNQQNWQRQREMIADERAYNDPKEQMKRLEEAGINTTFAGLNSNVSTGSDVGSQSPVQGIAPQISENPLSGLNELGSQQASIHLSAAQEEEAKAKAETDNQTRKLVIKELEASIGKTEQERKESVRRCNKMLLENGLISAQTARYWSDINLMEAQLKMLWRDYENGSLEAHLKKRAYEIFTDKKYEKELFDWLGKDSGLLMATLVPGITSAFSAYGNYLSGQGAWKNSATNALLAPSQIRFNTTASSLNEAKADETRQNTQNMFWIGLQNQLQTSLLMLDVQMAMEHPQLYMFDKYSSGFNLFKGTSSFSGPFHVGGSSTTFPFTLNLGADLLMDGEISRKSKGRGTPFKRGFYADPDSYTD